MGYDFANDSNLGAIAWQGPHHVAWKSMTYTRRRKCKESAQWQAVPVSGMPTVIGSMKCSAHRELILGLRQDSVQLRERCDMRDRHFIVLLREGVEGKLVVAV